MAIDLRRRPKLSHAPLEQGGRVAAEQERFGRFRRGIDEDRTRRRENARQFLPQKPDGTLDAPVKAGWDLKGNVKV